MDFRTCTSCGKEYYLQHTKFPFRDKGAVLRCNCGQEMFSYDNGTDDYTLIDAEVYRERLRRREEEEAKYPICDCGIKMVPRSGQYGDFFGCANFPNGCNKTEKR